MIRFVAPASLPWTDQFALESVAGGAARWPGAVTINRDGIGSPTLVVAIRRHKPVGFAIRDALEQAVAGRRVVLAFEDRAEFSAFALRLGNPDQGRGDRILS